LLASPARTRFSAWSGQLLNCWPVLLVRASQPGLVNCSIAGQSCSYALLSLVWSTAQLLASPTRMRFSDWFGRLRNYWPVLLVFFHAGRTSVPRVCALNGDQTQEIVIGLICEPHSEATDKFALALVEEVRLCPLF